MKAGNAPALLLLLVLGLALPPAGAQNDGGSETAPAPPAEVSGQRFADRGQGYTVGPADVLDVSVWDEPDLDGEFTVDAGGRIDYPLLGQVRVAGMDTAEIKQSLAELLERDYLYQADVTVRVKEHRSQKVEIRGDVGKPGVYFLDGPMRLLDLLVRADGISSQLGNLGSQRRARIVIPTRTGAGSDAEAGKEFTTTHVGLRELLVEGRKEANLPLHDGYVVYIPPALAEESTIHVLGEVNNPGSVPWEEGLTVLRTITMAKGTTKRAVLKKAYVTREQDGEILKIPVQMEDVLLPGDILTLPTSFW